MAQFAAPLPAPDDAAADNAGFVWHILLNGRAIDALGLSAVLKALPNRVALESFGANLGVAAAKLQAFCDLLEHWLDWLGDLAVEGSAKGASPYWNPQRLEYSFALGAQGDGAPVRLAADEYTDGRLDWHSFELGAAANAPAAKREAFNITPKRPPLPTAARYPGMPADRYFGVTMPIPQAGWNMFEMSLQANAPVQRMPDALYLCPALDTLQGPPLEHVVLMRDEMANMVWGIEKRVQGSSGEPIDRKFESTRLSTNKTLRPAADGSRPRPVVNRPQQGDGP